jgi:hypothetical protein
MWFSTLVISNFSLLWLDPKTLLFLFITFTTIDSSLSWDPNTLFLSFLALVIPTFPCEILVPCSYDSQLFHVVWYSNFFFSHILSLLPFFTNYIFVVWSPQNFSHTPTLILGAYLMFDFRKPFFTYPPFLIPNPSLLFDFHKPFFLIPSPLSYPLPCHFILSYLFFHI